MSKKRRVFDINFDDVPAVETPQVDPVVAPSPAPEGRRGPMATAITENADAVTARQSAEAAIRAENDALAHEHVRLKRAGLITDLIPLDLVDTTKLTRDRAPGRDEDMDDLKISIRDIGLSNPIRVEKNGDRYELIQGFRRLSAFRELFEETGDEAFAKIPAGINASGEDLQNLYRRMVDENLVRRDVSFGELARLAISYRCQDPNIESYDRAVEILYASSGRQKRSYIKSFVRLVNAIGDDLLFVAAMPRALGLRLVKLVEDQPDRIEVLLSELRARPDRDDVAEQAILQSFVASGGTTKTKTEVRKTAKSTFKMTRPEGVVKCIAADGRIELQLDRDFSGLERKRLEASVQAFFDELDGEG